MPQAVSDPVAEVLDKSPLTKADKAKVYDLYQQSSNEDDLATKLQAVGIPKAVKASLWDLKQGGSVQPTAPAEQPKWYQPGGDVVLDNLRKVAKIATNPEVIGTAAALATDGTSLLASAGLPAIAAGAASVGRDLVGGERNRDTIESNAATHALLNAAPGFLGWAGNALAKGGAKILPLLSHAPGVPGMITRAAAWGQGLANIGHTAATAISPVVTAAAADAGGSFLHYLTGTAMVDATPAERMILAKQRADLTSLATDKAAALAAEATARTSADAAQAASNAAKRIAVVHKAVLAGQAALAAGSVVTDNTDTK